MPTNRIAELRERNGLSRTDLVANLAPQRSGHLLSEGTLARWEKGQTKRIPEERVAEIAALFGVSRAYLLGYEDDDNGENGPKLRSVA